MSRFYKPVGPSFVDDVVFKLPYEEIKDVLQQKDQDIDDIYTKVEEMKDQLGVDVWSIDKQANEALLNHHNKMTSFTETLAQDYSKYSTLLPEMRKMSLNIKDDVQGVLKASQKNKEAYDKQVEKIEKLINVDAETKQGMKEALLINYEGSGGLNWDSTERKYNDISSQFFELSEGFDLNTFVNKLAQNFTANSKSWAGQERSKLSPYYFKNFKGSLEELTADEVRSYAETALKEDPNFLAATRQRLKFGEKLTDEVLDQAVEERMKKTLDAIVNKVAYKKTTSDSNLTADTMALSWKRHLAETNDPTNNTGSTVAPAVRPVELNPESGVVAKIKSKAQELVPGTFNYEKTHQAYTKGEQSVSSVFSYASDSLGFDFTNPTVMLENPLGVSKAIKGANLSKEDLPGMNTYFKFNGMYTDLGHTLDGTETGLEASQVLNFYSQNFSNRIFETTVLGSNGAVNGTFGRNMTMGEVATLVDPEYWENLIVTEAGLDPKEVQKQKTELIQETLGKEDYNWYVQNKGKALKKDDLRKMQELTPKIKEANETFIQTLETNPQVVAQSGSLTQNFLNNAYKTGRITINNLNHTEIVENTATNTFQPKNRRQVVLTFNLDRNNQRNEAAFEAIQASVPADYFRNK